MGKSGGPGSCPETGEMEIRQRALSRCLVPKLQGGFLSPVTVKHVCSLDQFVAVTLCWSSSLLGFCCRRWEEA